MAAASVLAGLTYAGLIALTFAIDVGAATSQPAWGAMVPKAVPRERLLSAMRAGLRFTRHNPAMQAAMLRTVAFFLPCALLPLMVRARLGLGAGSFGVLLGLMGVGGVASGLLLPTLRSRAGRGATVFGASLFSCAGMACVAGSTHWAPAGLPRHGAVRHRLGGGGQHHAGGDTVGSASFGPRPGAGHLPTGVQRRLGIRLAAVGLARRGWPGTAFGLQATMAGAAGIAAALAFAVRGYGLDHSSTAAARAPAPPAPEDPAPELASMLPRSQSRVFETMRYRVAPVDRAEFLDAMLHVQHARGRVGALDWRLY